MMFAVLAKSPLSHALVIRSKALPVVAAVDPVVAVSNAPVVEPVVAPVEAPVVTLDDKPVLAPLFISE